jgi:Gas vesicle protein G
VILLDRLFVGGLRFVLGKVAEAVDAERDEERLLQEELLALQMRLELGEIAEPQFAEEEAAILRRLREVREEREGGAAEGLRVVGVETAFPGEEHEPPPRKKRR